MEGETIIRVELNVEAQELISQYVISNVRIKKDIEAGIKRVFETIDLEKEVEKSIKNAVEKAIKDSSEWGKIREAVKKKTDEIVETYIEKSIDNFRRGFKTE